MIDFPSEGARQDFLLSWGIGAILLAAIGLSYVDCISFVPQVAEGWTAALAVVLGTGFFAVSYAVGTIISSIGVWLGVWLERLEEYVRRGKWFKASAHVHRCRWFKASAKEDRLYPLVRDAMCHRFKDPSKPSERDRDVVRLARAFVNEESRGFVRAELMFGIAVFYRGIAVDLLVFLVFGGVRIYHHFGAYWATVIFLASLLASCLCVLKYFDYMRHFYGNLFCQTLVIAARLSDRNAPRRDDEAT